MNEKYNYCHVAELTDIGCKRKANEDWLAHFESPNGLVAVVCDGMGGHVGGQIASHTAVEAIQQYMMQERAGTPAQLIVEAINAANVAILNRAARQPELTGMGSTCVMLIVRDGKVYIGSVGDSRVYLIRNHKILQLTVDQSYVQMLVDAGQITPEAAEHHKDKNVITNALGLKDMQPATVLPNAIDPQAGDCFLLCSDGLSGMVPDREIEKVVSRQSDKTQQERVEELVARARRNGGLDNITCQIVEFSITPHEAGAVQPWWRRYQWAPLAGAALAVLCLAALVWLFFLRKPAKPAEEEEPPVAQLNATVDNVFTLKKTPVAKGKVFLELTEDADFDGIKLFQRHPKNSAEDTTVVVRPLLSLKRMKVSPAASVEVKFLNADSTRCYLSFKKEAAALEELDILLEGDTTSCKFIIPLQQPDPSAPVQEPADRGKSSSEITEKEYTDSVPPSPPSAGAAQTDVSVTVSDSNQKLTLHSQEGTNTKTDLYFPELRFNVEGGSMALRDKGWYTIQNDGSTCVLVIKNTREHPVPSKGAVIKIPTTPDCNNGEGIIIRVNLVTKV